MEKTFMQALESRRTYYAIGNESPVSDDKIEEVVKFAALLFFEDQDVVKGLQNAFPSYADNFPVWSQQTSAMHQLAIWTMLEDLGFGVNLQHYNPLIDDEVAKEWSIPASWKLIAEMPFGNPLAQPGEKQYQPIEERVKVFK
jgi:predicted oxidoreductase (fatty acid repression mutant protein)